MRRRKVKLFQHWMCADVSRWEIYLQFQLSLHILHVGLLELNFWCNRTGKIGRCWDPRRVCQRPSGNVCCADPLQAFSGRISSGEVEVGIDVARLEGLRVYWEFVEA